MRYTLIYNAKLLRKRIACSSTAIEIRKLLNKVDDKRNACAEVKDYALWINHPIIKDVLNIFDAKENDSFFVDGDVIIVNLYSEAIQETTKYFNSLNLYLEHEKLYLTDIIFLDNSAETKRWKQLRHELELFNTTNLIV